MSQRPAGEVFSAAELTTDREAGPRVEGGCSSSQVVVHLTVAWTGRKSVSIGASFTNRRLSRGPKPLQLGGGGRPRPIVSTIWAPEICRPRWLPNANHHVSSSHRCATCNTVYCIRLAWRCCCSRWLTKIKGQDHNGLHKSNCHPRTDLDARRGCRSLDMARCYHRLPNSRLGESDASK